MSEIRVGDPNGGDQEYFELCGTRLFALDDLTYLVLGDDDAGPGGSGVIEAVISLAGQSLGADGFFVAAEATFSLGTSNLTTQLDFEDDDNVTHLLVSGFTGRIHDDLDVNDDGSLDVTPWTQIWDSVSLVGPGTPGVDGDHVYGFLSTGPGQLGVPAHAYRCTFDFAWTVGEADLDDPGSTDSPGADNASCSFVPPCGANLAGNCFEANGSPFCDDLGCCEVVVQANPLCAFEWSQDCADLALIECVSPCPWDCGGTPDGQVDTVDFLELLAQWGLSGTTCDFGLGNPGVDTPDFLQLLSAWGACP